MGCVTLQCSCPTAPPVTIRHRQLRRQRSYLLGHWHPFRVVAGRASYTIIIGERAQVCRTAGGETVYNLWGLGFYSPHMPSFATLTPDEPAGLQSTGQVAPVTPLPPREHTDQILVRTGRKSVHHNRRTLRRRCRSSAAPDRATRDFRDHATMT